MLLIALVVIASPVMLAAQPPAAAQAAPAAQAAVPGPMKAGMILAIGRIDMKPGKDMAVEKIEHSIAKLVNAKIPGMPRSLAMNTVAGPSEAWFLIPLPSYAALDTVFEMFPKLPAPVMAEWGQLNEQEGNHLNSGSMMLCEYLHDYSRLASTDVSPYRYMQVVTYRARFGREQEFLDLAKTYQGIMAKANPNAVWAMFELAAGGYSGTYLVFLPMKKLAELAPDPAVEKTMLATLGPEGVQKFSKTAADVIVSTTSTVFAFNPAMSSVAPVYAKTDPWWAWPAAAKAAPAAVAQPAEGKKPAVVPVKK
jgi:hypothetical protein